MMRFPLFAELDSDQKKIYSESPRDGAIIITGPPGSGKTVVAMHRAFRLANGNEPVNVIMFNKVLSRYTSNFPELPDSINVTHMHDWAKQWYLKVFHSQLPVLDRYKNPDWHRIREEIRTIENSNQLEKLNWGNLIIDEGQDFPPEMYRCLNEVIRKFKAAKKKLPTLTVFADENQTINNNCSSIQDLVQELNTSITNNRLWRLTKNYRNSKEIAAFSRFYQLEDISSTILPDRSYGAKPTIFIYDQTNKIYQQIVNIVVNMGAVEAGVIVFGTKSEVRCAYNKIEHIVSRENVDLKVQAYASIYKHHISDVENLHFDSPPSITIVHSQSSKGLEFDIVFLIKLDRLKAYDDGEISSYKSLYVATSRARRQLIAFLESDQPEMPKCCRLLPHPSENLCSFQSLAGWSHDLETLLDDVDWLPSATNYQRKKIIDLNLVNKLKKLGNVKATEILSNLASRSNRLHVYKTIIEETVTEGNHDALLNLILDLGTDPLINQLKQAS